MVQGITPDHIATRAGTLATRCYLDDSIAQASWLRPVLIALIKMVHDHISLIVKELTLATIAKAPPEAGQVGI
jgi:hypothetical protein